VNSDRTWGLGEAAGKRNARRGGHPVAHHEIREGGPRNKRKNHTMGDTRGKKTNGGGRCTYVKLKAGAQNGRTLFNSEGYDFRNTYQQKRNGTGLRRGKKRCSIKEGRKHARKKSPGVTQKTRPPNVQREPKSKGSGALARIHPKGVRCKKKSTTTVQFAVDLENTAGDVGSNLS